MALSTLALVTLTLSGVSASKHLPPPKAEVAPNQLETARLTQAAQSSGWRVTPQPSSLHLQTLYALPRQCICLYSSWHVPVGAGL